MTSKEQKISEACELLKELGLPKEQTNDRSALVLLSLAKISPSDSWSNATEHMYTTRHIMDFISEEYNVEYKPNTRETIRRQTLHQFEQAFIVERNADDPSRATNSPKNNYKITPILLRILHQYPHGAWKEAVGLYLEEIGSLKEKYAKRLEFTRIPIRLPNGTEVKLSPGEHNELHRDIVQEFTPRFIKGEPELLYIGDTASSRGSEGGKLLHVAERKLLDLGIEPMSHSKLPDVVIHEKSKNWIYLIEAVTSHGPVSHKRLVELEEVLSSSTCGKIYVTAFPDLARFKKYASDIAWETEVWISEMPDHMIHFNGDRFLGPR